MCLTRYHYAAFSNSYMTYSQRTVDMWYVGDLDATWPIACSICFWKIFQLFSLSIIIWFYSRKLFSFFFFQRCSVLLQGSLKRNERKAFFFVQDGINDCSRAMLSLPKGSSSEVGAVFLIDLPYIILNHIGLPP